MIRFDKPINLNGAELLAELQSELVTISEDPTIDGNGDLWLDIAESDKAIATTVVLAHNGRTVAPELTVSDKLASVGLSIDDLKAAILG
jgi:hypothetical protein